ncbi:unnamed protein product, partial [Anisakis simplex]|uniref:Uncharacterized protein n=1 Tax=Anisakis simplex TaxID=6269 RepID=A0A0M3JN81_ANISI
MPGSHCSSTSSVLQNANGTGDRPSAGITDRDRLKMASILSRFSSPTHQQQTTAKTTTTSLLNNFSVRSSEPSSMERVKTEGERSTVEKRFAYNLLEKLIQYLEQASVKMKTVKPSQELSRRNSFKKEGQDVKFFEKVSDCD